MADAPPAEADATGRDAGCGVCGIDAGPGVPLQTDRRSFSRKTVTRCAACRNRSAETTDARVWATLYTLAGTVVCGSALLGVLDPKLWWIGLPSLGIVGGLLLGILAHEAGHAAAAVLLGMPLWRIEAGAGRALLAFRVAGVRVRVGWVPTIGFVVAEPATGPLAATRQALFLAAGPGMDAVLLAAACVAAAAGALPWSFAGPFAALQVLVLVESLRPTVHEPGGLALPSDGWWLWWLLRDGGEEHRAAGREAARLVRVLERLDRGEHAEALAEVDAAPEGCWVPPGDAILRSGALCGLGRFAEAFEEARGALESTSQSTDSIASDGPRVELLNTAAWAALLAGGPGHLEEATRMAEEAVTLAPGRADVLDTAGVCLIAAGRVDAGLQKMEPLARRDPAGASLPTRLAWRAAAAHATGDAAAAAALARDARARAGTGRWRPSVEAILRLYAQSPPGAADGRPSKVDAEPREG